MFETEKFMVVAVAVRSCNAIIIRKSYTDNHISVLKSVNVSLLVLVSLFGSNVLRRKSFTQESHDTKCAWLPSKCHTKIKMRNPFNGIIGLCIGLVFGVRSAVASTQLQVQVRGHFEYEYLLLL